MRTKKSKDQNRRFQCVENALISLYVVYYTQMTPSHGIWGSAHSNNETGFASGMDSVFRALTGCVQNSTHLNTPTSPILEFTLSQKRRRTKGVFRAGNERDQQPQAEPGRGG